MHMELSPSVLAWLQDLDKQGWENPPGFDYFRALGEVVHRQRHIENILQTKLILDQDVQDASYFAELSVFSNPKWDPEYGSNTHKGLINLRFSNFGRMVAVIGFEVEKWDSILPQLYKYLADSNYIVLGTQILDKPYIGAQAQGVSMTWFGRFFNYL